MSEREDEGRTQAGRGERQVEGRGRAKGPDDFRGGHPPIIITGGGSSFDSFDAGDKSSTSAANASDDVLVVFDGNADEGQRHYTPEDPPTYMANDLRQIDFIRVTGDMTHECPDVPPNCRVVVTDKKRDTGNESKIEIDATSGGAIVIRFPGEYAREHAPHRRKKLRGTLKKIKSLEVFNSAGRLVHDCKIVRSSRNVEITICDDGCVE